MPIHSISSLTWRIDRINCGHHHARFDDAQRRDRELGHVGQTDGHDCIAIQAESLLETDRKGGTVVSELGKRVLAIGHTAHLKRFRREVFIIMGRYLVGWTQPEFVWI